jgi:cytoskeletal protein CcmA (bactofilin family)
MMRLAALLVLLLPLSVGAATLEADTSVEVTEPPLGNSYLAGSEVKVDAPLPGDLIAAAGTLLVLAPVEGDGLLAAGTIELAGPFSGDVRAAGGSVRVGDAITGELAVLAGRLRVDGPVGEVRAAGGTLDLLSGAGGTVEAYGGTITLAGEFMGNVRVVASDQVILSEGTIIHGAFEYNAPQEALIPASAVLEGGTSYIGSSSFLPTTEEAETFALAGIGIFFLVRLVAAMLAAGLVTGLFLGFARNIVETAERSPKRFLLLTLLGFAVAVATPILIILLLASFVGIGIAAVLGATYVLLLLLGYLYAAVIAGSLFARAVLKRPGVSWRSAAFGMLLLYLLGLIPGAGILITFVLSSAAIGAICVIFYRFSFGRDELK